MSKATILYIDDDRGMQAMLAKLLSHEGYDVRLALRGEEGLNILAHSPIDLLLLDISLPGIDGFEVCRRVRAQESLKQIPIIFLTGRFPSPNYMAKGLDLGADDYMTKPFDTEELMARIRARLRRKRERDDWMNRDRKQNGSQEPGD